MATPYTRIVRHEPCRRAALPDSTGAILVATGPDWGHPHAGSGAPAMEAGQAYRVVAQAARYESEEDNEDMGDAQGASWWITLYLCPATPEEAGPALAAHAARVAAATAAAAVAADRATVERAARSGWHGSDEDAACPAGRSVVLRRTTHGMEQTVAVLSSDGEAVAVWDRGYYDDYRATLSVVRDPDAARAMVRLLGGVQ